MRKLFLSLALGTLLVSPVRGADMPVNPRLKAAPRLALNNCGFYFGLYTIGGMGSVQGSAVTATGVNPNSITANEAAVGGLVGYCWNMPNSTTFVALEGMFGWNNVNGNSQGFAFSGPAAFKQRVLFGAPVDTIAQFFPTVFPFPVPNFPVTAGPITNIKPYLYGALNEDDVSVNVGALSNRDWSISPEFGAGMKGQLTPTTAIDVFAGAKFPQKGVCVGALGGNACAGMGTTAVAGVALNW